MKKITILAITLFSSIVGFAQFNQGRMLVGGSAEFRTIADKNKSGGTTTTNGTRTTLSVSPSFGYFVINQLAVGASLDMGLSKWNAKTSNDVDNNTTSNQFHPFFRYYLPAGVLFQVKFVLCTDKNKYDENYY